MTAMTAVNLSPLSCQGLGLQLAGNAVLHEIDLHLIAGETLGIVGPNGSGKSSLLKVLAGLRKPASGSVQLLGEALARLPRRRVAQALALVEQQADTLDAISVFDAVALGRTPGCRHWRRSRRKTTRSPSRPWLTSMRCTCVRACGVRCPVASASACISPVPWHSGHRYCCWTSRPTTWISSTS